MANKKLSAKLKKIPLYKTFLLKKNFKLPYPLMNIINGGIHANNGLQIQEFMIRPDKAKTFLFFFFRISSTHFAVPPVAKRSSTITKLLKGTTFVIQI